ncbi:hypothetical protein AAFF_G00270940 [Aldrovandia affinis]|uniref:Uncharacterized protein n=1 Tax=Aldrovandia affinis TaxID=143900 RepID=A0AAD7W2F1_9TELE|nr:hypothetical protein AAFF_G00270940 [Aldrovandia affinis]
MAPGSKSPSIAGRLERWSWSAGPDEYEITDHEETGETPELTDRALPSPRVSCDKEPGLSAPLGLIGSALGLLTR